MIMASSSYSCSFSRRGCTHDSMFSDAYQRTNRTKGTKILRCFPHCCPQHVERSYCGRSIHVPVDVDHSHHDPHAALDNLIVFAHFRPRTAVVVANGTQVSMEIFAADQQTSTNPTGEWIGARQLAVTSETSVVFEVNPSGRWYYQWESGATKAQRATDHQFTVYVLRQEYPPSGFCRVVASTSSPSFKLISFRRAPVETKLLGGASAAFDGCSDVENTTHGRWSMRESMDSVEDDVHDLRSVDPVGFGGRESTASASDGEGISLQPSREVRGISISIAAIVALLQRVRATHLDYHLPVLVSVLYSGLEAYQVAERDLSRLLRLFPTVEPSQSSRATRGVVRLAMWAFFNADLGHALSRLVDVASYQLLDKAALYTAYFKSLAFLRDYIDSNLGSSSGQSTCYALGEAAAAVVPSTLRQDDAKCRGLESFVAQAREVFLASHENSRASHRSKRARIDHVTLSHLEPFNGVWVADLRTVEARPAHPSSASPSPSQEPSVFAMLWMLRQLLHFEIAIGQENDNAHATLNIISHWNPGSQDHPPRRGSQLALDGKPRWLRGFPSGESTSAVYIGTQRVGHYVASFRSETRELAINCYTWPTLAVDRTDTDTGAATYCLRWCIRRAGPFLDVRLSIECGRLPRGLDLAAMDEQPLVPKLQAVERWSTLASLQYNCVLSAPGTRPSMNERIWSTVSDRI